VSSDQSRFNEVRTGAGTITFVLGGTGGPRSEYRSDRVGVVLDATLVSWHVSDVVKAVGEVPHAGVDVDPSSESLVAVQDDPAWLGRGAP